MSRVRLAVLATTVALAGAPAAFAQKPYIGFVYPAGGQQGTTFYIKVGGQGIDGIEQAVVSGPGVESKLIQYWRKIGPQDSTLLREQLTELRRGPRGPELAKLMTSTLSSSDAMMSSSDAMMMSSGGAPSPGTFLAPATADPTANLMLKIQKRLAEYVQRPACQSIASLAVFEMKIARDAAPGERELCVATPRGISNPMVFHVGQFPEILRKPMVTADMQVLGKEHLAQRKRPDDEVEQRLTIPCVANGQVATGEINYYRFEARKGQRLVISAEARSLVPFVADAVPGWFQPVMALFDSQGKEVAYEDDYRFKPDPVILFRVPADGEYVLTINDAIYRGREDFVHRITIGEIPFVTSIFPLGGRVGTRPSIQMKGFNVESAELEGPPLGAGAGIHSVAARVNGVVSNPVPYALDDLPEAFDREPNDRIAGAQNVKLPVIINGRMDRPDDVDVFAVTGKAGQTVVAEVMARRLDSPLDSFLKITDAAGKVLAFNDDCEDMGAGTNTHHADSYLMFKLPADGTYYVHLADAARDGGEAYGYRLRLSRPRPDFALRVVPSSTVLRSRGSNQVSVHVIRKDGFNGTIQLGLKDAPEGFEAGKGWIAPTQAVGRAVLRTSLAETKEPVTLQIQGTAKLLDGRVISRVAVPAEDRMQAFLWRHLVPGQEFRVLVYDPTVERPPRRVARETPAVKANPNAPQAKFTKGQVAGRLRQLKSLFEEGLLTDEFYNMKVAECEAAQ